MDEACDFIAEWTGAEGVDFARTIIVRRRFMKDYMDGDRTDLQAWGKNAIVLDDADVRRVLASIRQVGNRSPLLAQGRVEPAPGRAAR